MRREKRVMGEERVDEEREERVDERGREGG